MADRNSTHIPVIIIGGGPIGLFLGICLNQIGVKCKIFEQKAEINRHSRSIGIHPPSLDLFEKTNLISPFLNSGLKIRHGAAFVNRNCVGTVSFSNLPLPHNFILSLPQYDTERILESQLNAQDQDLLIRGAQLDSFVLRENHIEVHISAHNTSRTYTCDFLIGCDGKNSTVRSQAHIPLLGQSYPDTYIMGDFDDTTSFGSDAAVFLHEQGVVESFPIPEQRRRWVVKTEDYDENPRRQIIALQLKKRLNIDIGDASAYMISSFGVQHHLAEQFVQGRIILAGDAAHVVSPIGGQGMNLGWLDAWELSQALDLIFNQQKDTKTALAHYEQIQQKITQKTAQRAEWNMKLGRSFKNPILRKSLVTLLINTPLQHLMTRLFTMQHLEHWPI